eukprot:TRINITY_DN101732_c0_g1_i1.p2 TRINITY_DN101732_c0_g1~~TRINITY_DN101732_c0_g1_i1.p2  ORF type:complete len:212 (-),score=29.03 TRINITY_DN101732_c0_g1_i1:93-671(-)
MSIVAAPFGALDVRRGDAVTSWTDFGAAARSPAMSLRTLAPGAAAPVPIAAPCSVNLASAALPQYTEPAADAPAPGSFVMPANYVHLQPPAPGPSLDASSIHVGQRIVYNSRSTAARYPGRVHERNAAGCVIMLDIDGGVKQIEESELWRLEAEEADFRHQSTPAALAEVVAAPIISGRATSGKARRIKSCC